MVWNVAGARVLAASLAGAVIAGCASTSAEPGFRDVAKTIEQRTARRLHWNLGKPEDLQASRAVSALLGQPLSAESAVQVALLNSPSLQAVYEDLSVAQVDVVQAGLLSNPVFSIGMTTAERDAIDPNLIGGITQSFLDLLLIPVRKKIAAAEFEAAKFRVGNSVIEMATQVKRAFYTVEAAEQTVAVRRAIAEAEQASFEIAQGQAGAGNISELSLSNEKTLQLQTKLDAARSEADLAAAREELTRLLGLSDPFWKTLGRLPDVPAGEPSLARLDDSALRDRLDVAALRQQVQALEYALSLAKGSRWTGVIDIGADVARLKDGRIVVGPRASIELPIFDQRQAPIARLEAQLRASRQLLASRMVEARSEVRAARDRMLYARQASEQYRSAIIPTREEVVALSQKEYDAMLLGVYQLIAAKQGEVNAYREYIETVRDYWIARAELERALGGAGVDTSRPAEANPQQPPAELPSARPPEHHHPS